MRIPGALREQLPSNAVTVLNVYGSLFFAGARTLQEALPNPDSTVQPLQSGNLFN